MVASEDVVSSRITARRISKDQVVVTVGFNAEPAVVKRCAVAFDAVVIAG